MDRNDPRRNKVDVECPNWGRTVEVSAATILGHDTEKCPRCGSGFEGNRKAGRKLDDRIKKVLRRLK